MSSQFLRIGHRGAAAYATENTLSSIEAALACGVDVVEVDVRCTRDRQLVLSHDPVVRGEGQRRVKVSRHTLVQLQHICLPGGEVVTTLPEALTFVKGKAMVNVDLVAPGCEIELATLIASLNMEQQVMVSSTSLKSLRRIKALNPHIYTILSYPPASRLMNVYYVRWLQPVWRRMDSRVTLWFYHLLMRRLAPWRVRRLTLERGIDALIIRAPQITPKLIDLIHNQELKLYAWPADHAAEAERLKALGVDGAASNRPDVFNIPPDSQHLASS